MGDIKKITKPNATFQILESIKRSREKRNEHKLFLIEGVKPINLFLEYDGHVDSVLYPSGSKLSDWAKQVISKVDDVYEVTPKLFEQLSDRDETSELLLVGKITPKNLPKITAGKSLFVVLDRIKSPGNLGSIIRSSNAMGVDGVAILGHATDLYDPQTIRASIGSCFVTPVQFFDSNNSFQKWIEDLQDSHKGVKVVGTSEKGKVSVYDYSFTDHTVLLVGNETHGLSEFLAETADDMVSMPMEGVASSFNVACATTAFLYEIKRQCA